LSVGCVAGGELELEVGIFSAVSAKWLMPGLADIGTSWSTNTSKKQALFVIQNLRNLLK
jgi:hypothetical protein